MRRGGERTAGNKYNLQLNMRGVIKGREESAYSSETTECDGWGERVVTNNKMVHDFVARKR